jgi:hypothetical protein
VNEHLNPWRFSAQYRPRALFSSSAEWTSVTVRPGAGTSATVAMLIAQLADLLANRARLLPAAGPFVWALSGAAEALDRTVPVLHEPVPGSVTANYHVEAVS